MKNNIVYGFHAVFSLLKKSPSIAQKMIIQQGRKDKRVQELLQIAKKEGVSIETLSRSQLDTLYENINHQGVILLCDENTQKKIDLISYIQSLEIPRLLILDGVQDPHNLGACLRTVDAAGFHAIIAPKNNAVGLTPTVKKIACGAAESIPFFQVTNLARTMEQLKDCGVWLYGATMDGEKTLYDIDLKGPIALVLGSEGKGLRRLTIDHCDDLFHIPMRGTVSSLNVSVATAICLFEVMRQASV